MCRCVYDDKPRKIDANKAQIVCNLAELATRELEKNWALQVRNPCYDVLTAGAVCSSPAVISKGLRTCRCLKYVVQPHVARNVCLPSN